MDLQLNWGGPGYPAYDGYMKVSSQEQAAQAQTAQQAQYLTQMMQTQFAESQNLLNHILLPQLRQLATNPQGFGPQAMAAMRSQTIGTIGTQLAEQQRGLQQQFATQNMAGLGSGVEAAIGASLGAGAAGQEASSLQELAIANAQMQQQQRQFGLSGLAQTSQLLGAAPQSAGLAVGAGGQQFQQAQTMATQGGFWSNLLTGVLSSAAGGLTGGLSGGLSGMLGGLFKGGAPTMTQVSAAAQPLGAAQATQYPSLTAGIQAPPFSLSGM